MTSIIDRFSRYAKSYDKHSRVQEVAFSYIAHLMGKESPKQILDVGCGTGLFTARVADAFFDSEVIALDSSFGMLSYAINTHNRSNIHYGLLDWSINLETCSANLIISNAVLHWVDDLLQTFFWIKSHLATDGQCIATFFGPRTFWELDECLKDILPDKKPMQAALFRSQGDILTAARSVFSNVELVSKEYIIYWPSFLAFLYAIHFTGTSTHKGVTTGLWTPRRIELLADLYRKKYRWIQSTLDIFLVHIKA